MKMRVIAAALGGPWEVLYLSQKSVSKKNGGTEVPTSCACRKTRDLGCKPLGSALHLTVSIVRTILRGQFCFSGV